jgi:MSHA biogenesis protein MshN
MLKALEQREGNKADLPYQGLLEQEVYSEQRQPVSSYGAGLFLVTVAVAVVSVYWLFPSTTPNVEIVDTAVVKDIVPAPVASQPTLTVKEAPDFLATVKVSNQRNAVEERIDGLLRDAQLALLDNRLTDPVDDNAYTRFQTVLLLNPSQPDALAGIRSIVERYADFARQTNQRGEIKQSKTYWAKAELIARQYPGVAFWLDGQRESVRWQRVSAEPIAIKSDSADILVQQASDAAVEDSPKPVQLSVQPSSKYRDEKVREQASLLMTEKRWTEAEQLLLQALEQYPNYHESRQLLFNLYAKQKNKVAAEAVLMQLTNLSDTRRTLLRARLATEMQQWEQAAVLLEKNLLGAGGNLEYIALLAAVYHQLGRYQDAVGQYQQLLGIDNRNAAYWLGLAVSFDAVADKAGALRAFRYVRLHGGLDITTNDYVEQRINALSAATTAG